MRKTPLYPGEIHHVYNRGVNFGDIFFTRANRLFFLRRLRDYCAPEIGEIIAYCLMPNYFHLLIRILLKSSAAPSCSRSASPGFVDLTELWEHSEEIP